MQIPIQNIYYLLCYAWNKLDEMDIVEVESIQSTKLVDLFAKVLIGGTTHILKKGLDRGYILHDEDRRTLRGKIDFNISLKRNLFIQGKAHCHFDELNYNVLHNQILKTSIRKLVVIDELDHDLKNQLLGLYRRLHGIEEINLTERSFRNVKLNRNNLFYDFLLKVCELILDNLLVSEKRGNSKFRDFFRDEGKMRLLFEEFVRNFYKLEQSHYTVAREDIYWPARELTAGANTYLPVMRTDISLQAAKRKIIIDTKFSKEVFQTNFGKQSIKSSHLYQLFAYMRNCSLKGGINGHCEGILLYPTVNHDVDLRYEMHGHKISIKSINLNQDWKQIHYDLLEMLK